MSKILLIEDDQTVAESIAFSLHSLGHNCAHALNTQTALKLLNTTPFDAAMIDVWLEKEDGLNFLAQIGNRASMPPFIVISGGGPGRSLENVTARADAHGAVAFLYKPFDDDELAEAIKLAVSQ